MDGGDDGALLEVGRIGRAHGLRGELHVRLSTDRVERLTPGAVLRVHERELVVRAARPAGTGWIVAFEGVTDRSSAGALTGAVMRAAPLGELPDGQWWVHELIGRTVRGVDGDTLGSVTSVEANPAHDLLVLDDGTLVPMVFVVRVDPAGIVARLPEGLRDVGTARAAGSRTGDAGGADP